MSKVYVVTGFFRAIHNETSRRLVNHSNVLKAFDTVEKAVEYITYTNVLKTMDLLDYRDDLERNWEVETSEVSDDQRTIWHRLRCKNDSKIHWIVILDIHEMEVE